MLRLVCSLIRHQRLQQVIVFQVLADDAARDEQCLGRLARHHLERLLEDERRGEGGADLAQRLELTVLLLQAAQRTRVVDGDRRLHGELLEEPALGRREAPRLARLHKAEHADDVLVVDERRVERGLEAPLLKGGAVAAREARVITVHLDGLTALDNAAHRLPVVELGAVADLVAVGVLLGGAPGGHEGDVPCARLVLPDVAGEDAHGFADLAGDGVNPLL